MRREEGRRLTQRHSRRSKDPPEQVSSADSMTMCAASVKFRLSRFKSSRRRLTWPNNNRWIKGTEQVRGPVDVGGAEAEVNSLKFLGCAAGDSNRDPAVNCRSMKNSLMKTLDRVVFQRFKNPNALWEIRKMRLAEPFHVFASDTQDISQRVQNVLLC